ncbi:hypothetical protein [Enterovirga sp.]|jgi:hypothetical protein|uniref:hypothetical protein n=1 Tax=Enterovirga sp. TaxID=2026350 RepID=UPI00262909E8|nr:hypothetical protein [Enterovirga sp.]MDB5590788.1 hypothetical protein [Enterovirga sp.]
MLPTISRQDVGSPSEAGDYVYGEATVRVEGRHIAVWTVSPEARFNAILCTRVGDRRRRYALGQPTA